MSHFAKLENGIVTEITVAEKSFINTGLVGDEFLWVQTSYNGNFRKNYAVVGGTYDKGRDAFIAPKPFDSWTLDEDTCKWVCPVELPTGAEHYIWNEETQSWDEEAIE